MQSSLGPGTVPCAVVEDTKMSANSLEWLLFKVKKKQKEYQERIKSMKSNGEFNQERPEEKFLKQGIPRLCV